MVAHGWRWVELSSCGGRGAQLRARSPRAVHGNEGRPKLRVYVFHHAKGSRKYVHRWCREVVGANNELCWSQWICMLYNNGSCSLGNCYYSTASIGHACTRWPWSSCSRSGSCQASIKAHILNTPHSLACDWSNAKTRPKSIKCCCRESLGHDVCVLLTYGNMKHEEVAKLDSFADKVDVKLSVLGDLVMYWIRWHVDSGKVVVVCHRGLPDGALEFVKELSQPYTLSRGVHHCPILYLGAKTRHSGLAFRGPGCQCLAEEHT